MVTQRNEYPGLDLFLMLINGVSGGMVEYDKGRVCLYKPRVGKIVLNYINI